MSGRIKNRCYSEYIVELSQFKAIQTMNELFRIDENSVNLMFLIENGIAVILVCEEIEKNMFFIQTFPPTYIALI